ncbi:hypothetical protein HMPREF0539_0782, partial [Lacticaseibacillus rhamnosus LMS2-1]
EAKKTPAKKQDESADDIDLNDLSGLDFSQTSHEKKKDDSDE